MKNVKLVRRFNLQVNLTYSDEYVSELAKNLKTSISNLLYGKTTVALSLEELYMLVENLCTLRKDNDIKEELIQLIEEFLYLQLEELHVYKEEPFLQKLKEFWQLFSQKRSLIKNIYIFLEACTWRLGKKKISVGQICNESFKTIILGDRRTQEKLLHILDMISLERNGQKIDTELIRNVVMMLRNLDMYESAFEINFLKDAQKHYETNSVNILKGDISQYFYYVELRLEEEKQRVVEYLGLESKNKVSQLLFKILIEDKLPVLVTLLAENDIFEKSELVDIVTIYKQLQTIPKANEDFCVIFCGYLMKIGTQIIFDLDESKLIANLLDFKDKVDKILSVCFKNHPVYLEGVRICFKKFTNERKYKPAQFLAKFIDLRMRDKLIPEDLLDKIMVLFRYIQGKDVFEAYYKRYLSKRLLLGKSSSQDAEKYMISKLKLECGDGFTSKLEGIFRDIDLSANLVATFKQKHSNEPIDFSANVLTSSFWPSFTKYPVNIPDKLLHYQEVFQDFYKAKYSGRSLQWIGSLDTCLLKADLPNGKKEFQVSLFQALILLLFNEQTKISYKSIKLHLNLDDAELRRNLLSLLSHKIRLLNKNPASLGEIKDTDELSVNENLTNKLFRIKINQLQYKETEEERKFTEDEVLHDRHLQIDAALVRLMKQSHSMKHNDLVARIYNVLKFPINPNDIKKRIEILIERDFLSRSPDDANSYLYVA